MNVEMGYNQFRSGIKQNLVLLVVLLVFSTVSCGTRKISNHLDRQLTKITLHNDGSLRYYTYKMGGANSEFSRREFFTANYVKQSKNVYKILPNRFDNENADIILIDSLSNSTSSSLHIVVTTDINREDNKDYTTTVYLDNNGYTFSGTALDSTFSNANVKSLRVQVSLPLFYHRSYPPVRFTVVSTKRKDIKGLSKLRIRVPVSFETFYYKDVEPFLLRDEKTYWLNEATGDKIPK